MNLISIFCTKKQFNLVNVWLQSCFLDLSNSIKCQNMRSKIYKQTLKLLIGNTRENIRFSLVQ